MHLFSSIGDPRLIRLKGIYWELQHHFPGIHSDVHPMKVEVTLGACGRNFGCLREIADVAMAEASRIKSTVSLILDLRIIRSCSDGRTVESLPPLKFTQRFSECSKISTKNAELPLL